MREPQQQALRAPDHEGIDVLDARLAAFASRQLVEQRLEHDARFQAGQRRTEAKVAAEAERQRLARELHDAVTQTLFSASLIAEVLPRLMERNPDEGKRRLEELRQLARGALAEMRTLLLELRPQALLNAKFSDLLKQLGEAITARSRVPVQVVCQSSAEPTFPPDVQVALYRIAQEALSNVVRHAGATMVVVKLLTKPHEVTMIVDDDGRGFDPAAVPAGRYGLLGMNERVKLLGGTLTLTSKVSKGTALEVRIPLNGK